MVAVKKFVSIILSISLVLAFLPITSQLAYAAGGGDFLSLLTAQFQLNIFRLKTRIMTRRTKKAKSISRAKSLLLTISSSCRTCAGAFLLKIHSVLARE